MNFDFLNNKKATLLLILTSILSIQSAKFINHTSKVIEINEVLKPGDRREGFNVHDLNPGQSIDLHYDSVLVELDYINSLNNHLTKKHTLKDLDTNTIIKFVSTSNGTEIVREN